MSVTIDTLSLHIDYTAWATGRLLEAVSHLNDEEINRDFGTADKSVMGTLVHTFGADRIWLRRVRSEETGGFPSADEHNLAVLGQKWPTVYEGWKQWAEQLTPETIERPLDYRDMKGRDHTSLPWEIVLHVVNHGTHHRGQVSGLLRSLGKTPPPLDLIAFYRQRVAGK